MKQIQTIVAYFFMAMSVAHTFVGFMSYKSLTERALWFLSAGMALFFAGALNLIHAKNPTQQLIKRLTVSSNLIMTTFVLAFGFITFQENAGSPLAWVLIVGSLVALVVSART